MYLPGYMLHEFLGFTRIIGSKIKPIMITRQFLEKWERVWGLTPGWLTTGIMYPSYARFCVLITKKSGAVERIRAVEMYEV